MAYVSKVAGQMKVSVRFKTTSVKKKGVKTGEYRYASVVGLNVQKMHEEAEMLLNSTNLTEGVVSDWFKRQLTRMKEAFAKAYAYAKKSLKNAIDFLQVEPIIRVKTKVKL